MRQTGRRRSVRRSVAIECSVHSAYWDGAVSFVVSDLSYEGIWLETKVTLEPGDELLLSFVPPGARATVWAAARVVRVSGRDGLPNGMGLSFTFMSEGDRTILVHSLEGLPPHLPGARVPPVLPMAKAERPSAFGSEGWAPEGTANRSSCPQESAGPR